MRGSRNFHERGSNENGNVWSQTKGEVQPTKNPKITFFWVKFSNSRGVRTPGPPFGSAHDKHMLTEFDLRKKLVMLVMTLFKSFMKIKYT